MARPKGSRLRQKQPSQTFFDGTEEAILASNDLSGGVDLASDPQDLPPTVASNILNMEIRSNGQIRRRLGSAVLAPAKPNSNQILYYGLITRFDGSQAYIRFTRTGFHILSGSSWLAHSGGTFGGSDFDFISLLALEDRFFVANNGANAIQEINPTTRVVTALGNAPRCRFITSFADRVIAANLAGPSPNPTYIAWSANRVYSEWSQVTNISAGNRPLSDGGEDYSDDITGLFNLVDRVVILRERSIWNMTRRQSASSPFVFAKSSIEVGCDCPRSAKKITTGLMWYDRRTNQVYRLGLSGQLEAVGNPVRPLLERIVVDTRLVSGAFNSTTNTYVLQVPSAVSQTTTELWFHESTNTWTIHEYPNAAGVFEIGQTVSGLTINQLTGTINQLLGTINSLGGGPQISPASLVRATKDGDVLVESLTSDTDAGVPFIARRVSRVEALPSDGLGVMRLLIKYVPRRAGSIRVMYSPDRGENWKLYKTVSHGSASNRSRLEIKCSQFVNAPEYMWSVESLSGSASFTHAEIIYSRTGDRRQRDAGTAATAQAMFNSTQG